MDAAGYFLRVALSLILLSLCALLMLLLAAMTLFRARRLYAERLLAPCARLTLRVWGIRINVHHEAPFCDRQTVYVINHSSTLDVFAIVALGLPNTRFFLHGSLRKLPPLALIGALIGIFWTVDQHYPQHRRRIFRRAAQILRETGESVCLSPEGRRVTGGRIGPFNKGAFHLAAALRAAMQPIYIRIPRESDPGLGWRARPGTVHLYIGKPLDTRAWREEDAVEIKEEVRDHYIRWKEALDG